MQQGMHLPQIDRINKIFIIVLVAVFILNSIFQSFFSFSLVPYIGLSFDSLVSGKIWTIFSYSVLPGGIIEIIFNALIVWFIGSELSTNWGERKYLQFMAAAILGGAVIGLGASALSSQSAFISGASAFCSALCVAYGVINPNRTMYFFFFPLQAKWFVAILIAMNLYTGIFSAGGVAYAFNQLGAMASGWAWMVFASSKKTKRITRKKSNKSHLKIVEDDSDNKPTYH